MKEKGLWGGEEYYGKQYGVSGGDEDYKKK